MTIKYYLYNRSRNIAQGKECPIYMYIRYGKPLRTLKFNTNRRVASEHWDERSKDRYILPQRTGSVELNNWLKSLHRRVEAAINKEEEKGVLLNDQTIARIASSYVGNLAYSSEIDFYTALQKFIDVRESGDEVQANSGKPYSTGIIKHYKSFQKTIKEFSPKLTFIDITKDFHNKYTKYLRKDGYLANTIGARTKNLKTFMSWAKDQGYHKTEDYKKFSVTKKDVYNVYLNEAELTRITNLDLSESPRLDKTRDWFIIGCYTALRISDFKKLSSDDIKDGLIYVRETQKTSDYVVIPVHPRVQAIIEKYGNQLPPTISDQKFNNYIKEVCQLAELTEPIEKEVSRYEKKQDNEGKIEEKKTYQKWERISSHTCRRSGATNMFLAGVPVSDIMSITGHKTEASFFNYIKATPEQRALKMRSNPFFSGTSIDNLAPTMRAS